MVTTTFCVSGATLAKAGANVADPLPMIDTDYSVDVWITEAESTINVLTRTDYTTSYASLSDAKKKILQDVASSLSAIMAIQYDMSGYTSRVEAEDMINTLRDAALRGLGIIRDEKQQTFING